MTFADLVAGDTVFIDSNTFTYHFQPHPKWGQHCQQLLQRIENLEISGFTSLHVLGEVAHRMMTIEAHALWGWPFAGIGNRLRSNPAQVRKLSSFRQAIDRILMSRLRLLPRDSSLLSSAMASSQSVGLLANDAMIVALMQANGLSKLASNDADFDRVPGITRYAPA